MFKESQVSIENHLETDSCKITVEWCLNQLCVLFSLVEDLYETVNDREIRQVFEGQNRIHLEIKQLHRQLAMILDEQRRYVSVITDEVSKRGVNTESGQVGQLHDQITKLYCCLLFSLFIYFSMSLKLDSTSQLSSVLATQQEVLRNLNDLRYLRLSATYNLLPCSKSQNML